MKNVIIFDLYNIIIMNYCHICTFSLTEYFLWPLPPGHTTRNLRWRIKITEQKLIGTSFYRWSAEKGQQTRPKDLDES